MVWKSWPDAGVAIRTGVESGLLVLDVDVPEGGAGALAALERAHGKLPMTATVLTGGGGQHLYFRHTGQEVRNSAGRLGVGIDVRADGGYVVAPPTVHESGRHYVWTRSLDRQPLADPPAWLLADAEQRRNGAAPPVDDVIPEGRRRDAMLSLAGSMRRRGMTGHEIGVALAAVNASRCRPPLSSAEIESLAVDVAGRYSPDANAAIPTVLDTNTVAHTLDDVLATFRTHLHLPDPIPLLLTLATVVANNMEMGDPVWMVVVGGSSRGKTEIVSALDGLPGVRVVGALTVPALLSGSLRKERAKTATGGILRELGDQGILCVKDLGAILVLHRDARAQVLQALRDLFDGRFTRDVGADGGMKLEWKGRLGLIAGATSALDSAHAVMSALGERWVTVRLPDSGEGEMAALALGDSDTATVRAELRAAVHGFLASLERVELRSVTDSEKDRLVALSSLLCLARSPVERDQRTREIVYVHSPEGPARIVRQLHKLLVALEAMGVAKPASMIVRAGLDSIPSPRRDVLLHLLQHGEQTSTAVALALALPANSTTRACEELVAHGLLSRRKAGDAATSANLWAPTDRASRYWAALMGEGCA
jgi:hypothetical protein